MLHGLKNGNIRMNRTLTYYKTLILKFLQSLHWLLLQVGPIENCLSTETALQSKNVMTNLVSAYQHAVITIEFTSMSCLHYLKLALESLLKQSNNSWTEETSAVGDGMDCIPRFDTNFFGNAIKRNGQNESSDSFLNYALSSDNVQKILRVLIKRFVFKMVNLSKSRLVSTEKVLDSFRSPTAVFGCVCLQDMMTILYHFMDLYFPTHIWKCLSDAIKNVDIGIDQDEVQKLYRFFWIFLIHFARLISEFKQHAKDGNEICDVLDKCGAKSYENCSTTNQHVLKRSNGNLFEDSQEIVLSFLKEHFKLLEQKYSEPDIKIILMSMIQFTVLSREKVERNRCDEFVVNVVALSYFWDFFSTRLNNLFQGAKLTGLQMIPTSQETWKSHVNDAILLVNDMNELKGGRQCENTDFMAKTNGYYLFVRLISVQINPYRDDIGVDSQVLLSKSKFNKSLKQFVGRLRSKLPASKIQRLEDVGLHNLFTMFIAMILSQRGASCENFYGIGVIAEAVLGLAREEIKPANSVLPKRITIYLRGIVTVIVLLVQTVSNSFPKYTSVKNNFEEFQKDKEKVLNLIKSFIDMLAQRVESVIETQSSKMANLDRLPFSAVDNAMRVYCDMLQDHNCLLNSVCISQTNLIFPGVGKYLNQKYQTNSGVAEVNHVLTSLIAVTTRIRKYYQQIEKSSYISLSIEERNCKERVDETCINLWKHIYPMVKTNLCTYTGGISGGLSSKIANKVAEFVISMTLLSQDLSHSSFPPMQCNRNSVESFSEMLKYYSLSPVVHPCVSSAFVLNVLQQNKRGFVLDLSQMILLIKSWIRCNTLLLPTDETLHELPRYIVPLCKEISITSIAKWNVHNGITLLVLEISKLHIQNDFSQSIRKKYEPIFDSYIDCINRCFSNVIDHGSQANIHRMYEIGSVIVKNCARLLYEEKSHNKLQPILTKLFTSANMLKEDYNMKNDVKFATSRTLPDFIRGICTLPNLQKDQFLIRNLKYIFVSYLHRYDNNDHHPFIEVFKTESRWVVETANNYPMSDFLNYQAMYFLFFTYVKKESFSKHPSHKQRQKLKYAIGFILTMLKCVPEMSSSIVQNLLGEVLDIRLTLSNDETGIKNLAAELISKVAMQTGSTMPDGSKLSQLVLVELEKTIQSHLAFYVEETYQLLVALSTINKNLIQNLLPNIEVCVTEIEIKRGIEPADGSIFHKRLNELKKRVL